jgi:ankyrin repeat protein
MSSLHAYFAHRNQHAFQRTLEAARHAGSSSHTHSHNKSHHNYTDGSSGGPGTSGGKSWTKSSGMNAMSQMVQHNSHGPIDINARDWLGRTVLHLACAATDNAAVEYVRMVLAHPGVNVNLQDRESMWTALHRALYHGNLASA